MEAESSILYNFRSAKYNSCEQSSRNLRNTVIYQGFRPLNFFFQKTQKILKFAKNYLDTVNKYLTVV